jgi:hypothetical protein
MATFLIFFVLFLMGLGFELGSLFLQSRSSTSWAMPPVPSDFVRRSVCFILFCYIFGLVVFNDLSFLVKCLRTYLRTGYMT